MEQIKILFGFDAPKFEKEVLALLKKSGYAVESTVKLTKSSIRDFLLANPSYETAVLLEVMNNSADRASAKYTADELAMLTDERSINIVVLLNDNHKGTKYMETLYTAGITSAIYQKGRHGGATPKDVVERILNKRNNRQAREYYGIADAPISLGFLGNETFAEYYNRLQDPTFGTSLIERFVNVCRMMNQKQIADFIRRTPAEVLDELKMYEEFYVILDIIKGNGIDLKIKRPKRVQIGLSTPGSMERVRLQIGQNGGISHVMASDGQVSFSGGDVNRVVKEPIVEEKKVSTAKPVYSNKSVRQSFADMLDGLWDDEEVEEECTGADDSFFADDSETGYTGGWNLEEDTSEQMMDASGGSPEDFSVEDFINKDERKGKQSSEKKSVNPVLAIFLGVMSALLILAGVIMIIL